MILGKAFQIIKSILINGILFQEFFKHHVKENVLIFLSVTELVVWILLVSELIPDGKLE